MEILDAEWQWDRRKLTFYYTAETRVDFRELVRELFRIWKTRVWLCVHGSPPSLVPLDEWKADLFVIPQLLPRPATTLVRHPVKTRTPPIVDLPLFLSPTSPYTSHPSE